ncbi:MAG: hypothetical protein WEB53_08905 [Akkermansiaceae bacterium]
MLRLSEKPLEWIKFTAVIGVAANGVLGLMWRKGALPGVVCLLACGVALATIVAASIRPHGFRGFYRGGMTISFKIGQVIGKVLLTLFFLALVTPMGLLLRLLGKDLLRLKKDPTGKTYWRKAKDGREFDRMF